MPMNRKLYPKNWDEIARTIKTQVNWHCESCDRPCRTPGEIDEDLIDRISNYHEWVKDLYEEIQDDEHGVVHIPKLTRFTLTVAHLDHIPENCDRSNLRAWCTVCHCRYDLKAMALKRRLKLERLGQLRLAL
jgi:hypothetical protein